MIKKKIFNATNIILHFFFILLIGFLILVVCDSNRFNFSKKTFSIGKVNTSRSQSILMFLEYLIIVSLISPAGYFYWEIIPKITVMLDSFDVDLALKVISDGTGQGGIPTDLPRQWPSGVFQGLSASASAVATYAALTKMNLGTPRSRILGALGVCGITTSNMMFYGSVENSVGTNRLLFGATEYLRTGRWPSIDEIHAKNGGNSSAYEKIVAESEEIVVPSSVTDAADAFGKSEVEKLTAATSSSNVPSVAVTTNPGATSTISSDSISSNTSNSFLPSSDPVYEYLMEGYEYLFRVVFQSLNPTFVQGHLDDLLGQRMFIVFLLLNK